MRFASKLLKRQEEGSFRSLTSSKPLIDLTSNDYLGFARSLELREAVAREWERMIQNGTGAILGSTGSRLLTGNQSYCEELERTIANFHRAEAGLIFNTGYMANLGLISSLAGPDDTILYDLSVHASLHDGMRLSRARCFPFRHNDSNHLEKRLKVRHGKTFVCIESIYTMDGSQAPLKEMAALCEKYGAHLIVDEAHATGIFGSKGEGLVCHHQLEDKVFARVHPFGKALGSHGAIILGQKSLQSYLINFARSFIYSTALPPQVLATIKCAYERLPLADGERQQVEKLRLKFIEIFNMFNFSQSLPQSPLIPFLIGDGPKAKALSSSLGSIGVDVRPILSPTVKRKQECLRICLHSFNSDEDIFQLLSHIASKREG